MFQTEKLNAVKKETLRKSTNIEEDEEPEDLDEEVLLYLTNVLSSVHYCN